MTINNNNVKDNSISTWLSWKLSSYNKSFHPGSYHKEFRNSNLWKSLFEQLGFSKAEQNTNFALVSIGQIIEAQGIKLPEGFSLRDIQSGNADAIRDLLIKILFHYYGSNTLESQVAEIVCEPPYNLQKSEPTDFVTNGKFLCALVHSKAMVFSFHDAITTKSNEQLVSFVLDTAESKLGIPKFFKAEDLVNKTVDMLPLTLFVGGVLRHKGIGGFSVPSIMNKSTLFSTGLSVTAGGSALKKFQDQNLAAEIQKLKETLEEIKKNNENEINATKATLKEQLKNVEKVQFEETMQVKRRVEEETKAREAEIKKMRDQVKANEEQLQQIEQEKITSLEQQQQYGSQLEDIRYNLCLAISKKRRERAKAVEVHYEQTLDTVRENYHDIQKKLKQIENLKEMLLNKSKSLEEQRAEYAARSEELKDLTSFITDRINFLVNRLDEEKKTQTDVKQNMTATQALMQARSQEELKLLRQQEEELRRLKQRMDSEQRKIDLAAKSTVDLFMDNDSENEKTKDDDGEGDFDRADKDALQSELDGFLARRQICYASLDRVRQQQAEVDRSQKEVLSELEKLDKEEQAVRGRLQSKPPQERVVPQLGALVMLDDEISLVKMMESNLNYDLQELDTEMDQLKVEKWNIKTHVDQVRASMVVLETEIQVMRDMEVLSPSSLKALVSGIIDKAEVMTKEKSRLKQWRNYYFGKYNKTNSQLEASGQKELIKEQLEDDKDEDVDDDDEPSNSDSSSMVSGNGSMNFDSPQSSPSVARKDKRKSWNLSLRLKGEKASAFSQSTDGKLAPPAEDKKSKRKSITGAFASLVPKIFT